MEEVSGAGPFEPSLVKEAVSQPESSVLGQASEKTVQDFDEVDYQSEFKGYESKWGSHFFPPGPSVPCLPW